MKEIESQTTKVANVKIMTRVLLKCVSPPSSDKYDLHKSRHIESVTIISLMKTKQIKFLVGCFNAEHDGIKNNYRS